MPDELILPIPPVPQKIRDAVNTKTLAVFVGAGVSRIMGCMGWDELATRLIKRCTLVKRAADGLPYLNFRETEILARYNDHKKTITICYDILKDNGCEDNFFEELKKSFELDEEHSPYQDIYQQLYGLRGSSSPLMQMNTLIHVSIKIGLSTRISILTILTQPNSITSTALFVKGSH